MQESKASDKLFQKVVRKLIIEKGIASGEGKQAKKRDGFLSIEKVKSGEKTLQCVVFRSFQGFTHFSAVVNKNLAKKVEEVDPKRGGDHRLRIFFFVKNPTNNQMQKESVVINFFSQVDKADFKQAYAEIAKDV